MRLEDFGETGKKRINYFKIARELSKTDNNMAIWLDIWENGIKIKVKDKKQNKKIIYETKPHDRYIRKQIEKAVKLRLDGKVFGYEDTERR